MADVSDADMLRETVARLQRENAGLRQEKARLAEQLAVADDRLHDAAATSSRRMRGIQGVSRVSCRDRARPRRSYPREEGRRAARALVGDRDGIYSCTKYS